MRRLFRYLLVLVREKFWGDVTITFKDGTLIHVRATRQFTEETLPVTDDPPKPSIAP